MLQLNASRQYWEKQGVYLVVNEFMLCCFSQMQVFADPLKAVFNLCSICNLIRF